jgi:hypothetical protein
VTRKKKAPVSKPPSKKYVFAPTDANVIIYLQRQSSVMDTDVLHPKPVGLPRPKVEPLSLAAAIVGGRAAKKGKPNAPKRIGTRWPTAA